MPQDWNQTLQEANDNYNLKITEVGSISYIARAKVGTLQEDPYWQVKKVDETSGLVITWADGDEKFDNVATDLTVLTYT